MRAGKPKEAVELLELALRHHVGNPRLTAKLAEIRSATEDTNYG